jgi:23S rRNA (uracil1939-C5)-methyltransferase
MKPDIFTIEILTDTHGGESLGRLPDGRAVFVPFAIPGEIVKAQIVEEKKRFARADLLEVIKPSKDRISPKCANFLECGGCQYQMINYTSQLAAKENILLDQLTRIGRIEKPTIMPIIPSPTEFNYRNTVQFHVTNEGKLGFHHARSNKVMAISECHLPDIEICQIWKQIDLDHNPNISQIHIRHGCEDDIQIILESNDQTAPELSIEELPVSVVHRNQNDTIVLAGSSFVVFEILGYLFQVSADSFFQVNTTMAGKMVTHVLETLKEHELLKPTKTIIDAYSGVGLFSAFIVPYVEQVIGVESNPSSCEDYVMNLDQFDNVSLYEGDAGIIMTNMNTSPDAIILDPPRAGISRQAMDGVLKLSAELLIYVSCDPSTLARDAKRLISAGYQLEQTTPFDLFPQTYHIESISTWVR